MTESGDLERIFGDPLPDRTVDEQDVGWGEQDHEQDDDLDRFRRERPPHHGD